MPATRSSTRRRSGQAGLTPQNDSGIGPSAGNSQDAPNRGFPVNLETIPEVESPPLPGPSKKPSPQRAATRRANTRRVNSSPYARDTTPAATPEFRRPDKLELREMGVQSILGTGSYGTVAAIRILNRGEKATPMDRPGAFMAMKAFDKYRIRRRERRRGDFNFKNVERMALSRLPWNPFVSGLLSTFVDEKKLYQLMELGSCGTLMQVMKRKTRFSESTAKFYFSNIILGLEFIHTHGIIHRDLKPENIFVNGDGYLMLGDFGCSAHWEEGNDFDWHGVGTQIYMSPECADRTTQIEHFMKASFDYWSAGVILFEMLNGVMVPTLDKVKGHHTYDLLQEQFFKGEIRFNPESKVSAQSQRFIEEILHPIQGLRLQSVMFLDLDGPREAFDIRDHAYMADINWDDIAAGRRAAPWVPIPTPRPDLEYQWEGRPNPEDFPGLQILEPASYLQADDRWNLEQPRSVLEKLIPH